MQPILTERLQLRPPCKQDAAPLLAIRNSPFVLRYNAMRPLTLQQMEQKLTARLDAGAVLQGQRVCYRSCLFLSRPDALSDRFALPFLLSRRVLVPAGLYERGACRPHPAAVCAGRTTALRTVLFPEYRLPRAACQAGLPTGGLPAARRTGVQRNHLRRLPVFNPEGRILI